MSEQLQLDIAVPQVDYLTQHGMRLDQRPFDASDCRSIGFMRRGPDECAGTAHLVWVLGLRGQARLYALVDGELRHTNPCYAGDWPELDSAVAARLGVPLFADVTWRANGPVENWRLDHG